MYSHPMSQAAAHLACLGFGTSTSGYPLTSPTLFQGDLEMPVDFTNPEQVITSDPESSMFAPTPVWDRNSKKRVAAGALAAGVVVVGALGGVGWHASQQHARGVAELTPDGPAT